MNSDNTKTLFDADRMLSHAYWYASDGDARQLIYRLRNEIREKANKQVSAIQRNMLSLNYLSPYK